MKRLLLSLNSEHIGLAKSKLDAAEIPCEVRNDAVSQAIPGMAFATELWVLSDQDYDEARQLIGLEGTPPPGFAI